MKDSFLKLLNAFLPLLVALASMAVIYSPFRLFTKTRVEFGLPLYNILVPIGIPGEAVANGTLCLITVLSVFHFFFRDYAFLFPRHVKYDVYYDQDGLSEKIAKLPLALKKKLPIPVEWDETRQEIFCWIDSRLAESGAPCRFFSRAQSDRYMSSKGKAEHVMKLHKHWQKYRLTEVSGEVVHKLRAPNIAPQEIVTRYHLIESSRNILKLTLRDFLAGCYIAMPRMAQNLTHQSQSIYYDEEVVGITFIRIFPLSMLEFSLFCMEKDNLLIPMAYAEYE